MCNYQTSKNTGVLSSLNNHSLMNDPAKMVYITINNSTRIPLLIKPQYHINNSSSVLENTHVFEQKYYIGDVFEKERTKLAYVDVVYEEARKHLNKLYSLHNSDAEMLGYAFEVIESAFARHDLLLVDALLANFEPNKTKTIISTGLLRATFRAKTKLNSWKLCAAHVSECLNGRGENTKHLLRGLIRADDSITITTTALS